MLRIPFIDTKGITPLVLEAIADGALVIDDEGHLPEDQRTFGLDVEDEAIIQALEDALAEPKTK